MSGRFGTIRFRLTLVATAVVAATLSATAFGVVAVQRRLLTAGINETLRQRADNLAPGIDAAAIGARLPIEGDSQDSFLQLVDSSGRVIASTGNIATSHAVVRLPAPGSSESISTVSGVAATGGEYRVLARRVGTRSDIAALIVARNLDDVNHSVRILTTSMALSIPVVALLLAILIWWLTGRVLQPVEAIRAEVATIEGGALHRRVPTTQRDDEIARLAHTMNAMLDRVENATERQRQFVGDASHELRIPLTRIRTDLEVCIAHPDSHDSTVVYESLLTDAIELQQLIDDLLFLARSDAGPSEPLRSPVDLDDLMMTEARRLRDRGRVTVHTNAVSAARVLGDQRQLARAVRNLVDNAERHATTTVSLELRERDGKSLLVVADDGPGVPSQHHETIFERFTRLDEARSRDAGGSGLGLAIVRDIVTRHGGKIEITSAADAGARFVITLPQAD